MTVVRTTLVALLLAVATTQAQPPTQPTSTGTSSLWFAYMANIGVSDDLAVWFDTHYNLSAFFVLRGGLTKRFEAGPALTAGYAQLWIDPGDGTLNRQEYRPWAQVVFPFRLDDVWTFSQRIRYDMRIQENVANGAVTSGTTMTHRIRFQSVFTRYFGDFLVQAANETLVNFGPAVGPNWLDQNRLSLLGGIVLDDFTFRSGYMYRFIPGSSGLNNVHESSLVVWVNHHFDFFDDDAGPVLPEVLNP